MARTRYEPIPTGEAVAALKKAAAELRGLVRFTDLAVSTELRNRRELAANVLEDVASNLSGGAVQLVRAGDLVFVDGGVDLT